MKPAREIYQELVNADEGGPRHVIMTLRNKTRVDNVSDPSLLSTQITIGESRVWLETSSAWTLSLLLQLHKFNQQVHINQNPILFLQSVLFEKTIVINLFSTLVVQQMAILTRVVPILTSVIG